uniref:RING-type domain-containing protein n=1 Tax=Globodera pallida TaxID=36090 RepID=A0A183BXA0_GLOPA
MLSVQLSAVQLCIDIDRDLALNDSRITKFANLAKKNKKKKVDIDMRTEFDQLRSNISQNKIVSPVDVCHLWEFQLLLNDLNQALNQDGIFIKEVKVVNKNYDCNELKNIDGILPIWAPDFKKNITLRHLKFISSKLASDFIIKDFSRWFSTERFANECVLLHRFRIINAGGDFEQTLRVKSVLTQFLLSNQDIDMLDMFYPFEAAADVLFEETEKLKQIFEIVDEHQKIMTSKIWEIFEVMVNINPIVYDENETYKMNLYMECPNDQVVYHLDEIDQNEIAEDLEAYTLMQSYYNLMEKVENSQKNKQIKKFLQKLEMDAAVWVYKDLIQQELFEFAAFLDVRTDEFDAIIEHYSSEWYEVSTNGGQSVYNALCSIHQFAQTIVEDTILMQNVGWNFHVKSLLETPTSLYDTKLILLPTEKGTDLAKIDCSDGKLAYKFMKQKFSWIVPSVVFEAVEATFPEIMQYDLLLDSQYISLLVYRLLFKTGTNFAKFYEARIANHFILLLDESFRAQLMAIPGAKTRIWKMTSVQQPHLTNDFKQDNEFLKLWDEAGMTTDVFNDDRILHAHYNCILFGELSCTSTSKMGTLLLADLILFVRWVENRIGTARHTIANKRMANSWEKDKKQLDNIYDQIYDEDDQAIMLIHRI